MTPLSATQTFGAAPEVALCKVRISDGAAFASDFVGLDAVNLYERVFGALQVAVARWTVEFHLSPMVQKLGFEHFEARAICPQSRQAINEFLCP